jgi:hypothetical protein
MVMLSGRWNQKGRLFVVQGLSVFSLEKSGREFL